MNLIKFSEEEISDLFRKYNELRDEKIKEEIYFKTEILCYSRISNRFKNYNAEYEDLLSIAKIGLYKAINMYDNNRNSKFVSFAIAVIDNEILHFIRKDWYNHSVLSLDSSINNSDLTLQDIISDSFSIEEAYIEKEKYEILKEIIAKLPLNDAFLIRLYFGLDGRRYSQIEIANLYHVDKSYISRSIAKILDKISIEYKKVGYYNNRFKKLSKTK